MLAATSVTTGAIQDSAVTAAKIATGQVVKSVNGLTDGVTIAATGGATINTSGSTVTVNTSALVAPSGTMVLGAPGDTNLIGAGYTEVGPSPLESWRATSLTNAPTGRYLQTAVWTGTKMIVWGGYITGPLDTGAQYDPATDTWTATSMMNAPSARYRHAAVWASSAGVMIVWGGNSGSVGLDTGGQYNPAMNTWTATKTFGAPAARSFHIAVWTGTYMVVWGGISGLTTNTGGRYRPVQDDWDATTTTMETSDRYFHTAVWTGSSLIECGGS